MRESRATETMRNQSRKTSADEASDAEGVGAEMSRKKSVQGVNMTFVNGARRSATMFLCHTNDPPYHFRDTLYLHKTFSV